MVESELVVSGLLFMESSKLEKSSISEEFEICFDYNFCIDSIRESFKRS